MGAEVIMVESINFGAIPSGSAALIYIAQDQPFFKANGLSVNVKDYATGVAQPTPC
jgi:ABC-type nitrate/sulfonate/bicarbonate transport system substrate-binding protein